MVFLRRPQKPLACSSTFLCLAWATTPLFTRAMSAPPYGRPLGRYDLMMRVSDAFITLVPRFWRMYLALWLISRWRLPATPALILPVAVSLKRFLAPDLVFSFGISSSLGGWNGPPWHACWPGDPKRRALLKGTGAKTQADRAGPPRWRRAGRRGRPGRPRTRPPAPPCRR